jgi:glycine cleavage system transcriptional repressor
MNKFIITILGQDRPGILAAATQVLFEQNCNLENVSQTILQSQFVGTFIATSSDNVLSEDLKKHLDSALNPMGLEAFIKQIIEIEEAFHLPKSEPFIITTKGPDRKGLVAGITAVIARYGANIANLQAIFKGGEDPLNNIMIYEVDVPTDIDRRAFQAELREKADELDLEISIQHRNIFKAINRI